uniref:Non-specific serine/threonine protein kinase n=1 Tax=Guillardia theta TaxID=55529 RepID=A0A7S4KK28_GUITH|mmetsp:Transcript_26126/g.85912  ORF Transcript_26126/g.85912 Transcript_26126/m.85912 type:complete len:493 (+) Transcript_26126:104-1582(+)
MESEGAFVNVGSYEIGKLIGSGAFSKVRLATHVTKKKQYAMKIVDKDKIQNIKDLENVMREMHVLKNISHPNIISMHEAIEKGNKLFLVLDYAKRGQLQEYIVATGPIPESEARPFFVQITSGLDYCHRQGISHRDIKPENILLVERDDKSLVCKIADFGLSNDFRPMEMLKTICGTPCFAAPEITQGQKYDGVAVDVWSLGATLFTMVAGKEPFSSENQNELFRLIQGALYSIPPFCSPDVADIIGKFLVVEPEKRMHLSQVWQHRWLAKSPLSLDTLLLDDQDADDKPTSEGKEESPGKKENSPKRVIANLRFELLKTTYLASEELAKEAISEHNVVLVHLKVSTRCCETFTISEAENEIPTTLVIPLPKTKATPMRARSRTVTQPRRLSDADSKFSMPTDLATIIIKDVKAVMSELTKQFQDHKITTKSSTARSIRGERNRIKFEISIYCISPAGDEACGEHKLLVASSRISGDEVNYRDICRRVLLQL